MVGICGGNLVHDGLNEERTVTSRRLRQYAIRGSLTITFGSGLDLALGKILEQITENYELVDSLSTFGQNLSEVSGYVLVTGIVCFLGSISQDYFFSDKSVTKQFRKEGKQNLANRLMRPILPLTR